MDLITKIRAFILRVVFYKQAYRLKNHPILKGKLFQRIKIANTMYYHVGDYICLKSKNQFKEI